MLYFSTKFFGVLKMYLILNILIKFIFTNFQKVIRRKKNLNYKLLSTIISFLAIVYDTILRMHNILYLYIYFFF